MSGKVTQGWRVPGLPGSCAAHSGALRGRRAVGARCGAAVNTAGPPMGPADVRAGRARRPARSRERERGRARPAAPRRQWEAAAAAARPQPHRAGAERGAGSPSDAAMRAAGGPGVG